MFQPQVGSQAVEISYKTVSADNLSKAEKYRFAPEIMEVLPEEALPEYLIGDQMRLK